MSIRSLIFTALFVVLSCLALACNEAESCESHDDCALGEVCQFGQEGVCLQRCSDDGDCSLGSECNSCGASSCPACDDCVAVCVSRF